METCLKYNRAQAPIFTDQEELTELLTWTFKTTRDPVTRALFEDLESGAYWLPIRHDIMILKKCPSL